MCILRQESFENLDTLTYAIRCILGTLYERNYNSGVISKFGPSFSVFLA